jgi:hypothetical protein
MADGEKKGGVLGGTVTKIIATVFAAVVAPIVVALSMREMGLRSDKDPYRPPPPAVSAAPTPSTPERPPEKATPEKVAPEKSAPDKPSGTAPGKQPPPPPPPPPPRDPTVSLIQAGLAPFVVLEPAPGGALAKPKDAADAARIFRLHDKMIQAPGERPGALQSKDVYENYRLVIEYKIAGVVPASALPSPPPTSPTGPKPGGGAKTDPKTSPAKPLAPPPPAGHATGPYVNLVLHYQDPAEKLTGYTCMFHSGRAGALLLRGPASKISAQAHATETETDQGVRHAYKPDAPALTITPGEGRLSGRVERLEGRHGSAGELEKPGDWNQLEIVCDKDTLTVALNGKVVNALSSMTFRRGKIVLMVNEVDIYIRRFDLLPLEKKVASANP